MTKTVLYPHQKAAIKKAQNVLQSNKAMRFNMCTGAGKTVTTVHTIETLFGNSKALVVVAAHTNILVEQFKQAVEKERKNNFPNSKLVWEFDTYQSLVGKDKLNSKVILVVDEVHQGGLESLSDKLKSYQIIHKTQKPFKIISLSATDSGVNEKLFGVKKNNTFFYTYNDAMRDGVINDCTITTIHTGLEQYFLNKDSKAEYSKTYTDLESAYEDCLENGVNFKDEETVRSYEEGKIAGAIATYFEEWKKDTKKPDIKKMTQAIFYVKTIELAERGVQLFTSYYNHYLNSLNVSNYPDANTEIVRAAHSFNDDSSKNINDFKNKLFKVLFNVKQVQEGFDYPELSMIFDCAPSFSNHSRIFQQRLGRALRKHGAKTKPSQYFIVTGLASAVSPRYSVDKFRETVSSVEGMKDISNDALGAFVEIGAKTKKDISTHFSNKNANEHEVNLDVSHIGLFDLNAKHFGLSGIGKKINIQTVTGNLIVTGAYGKSKMSQVFLSEILKQGIEDPAGKKQRLYEMALKGEPKIKSDHELYGMMLAYSNPKNKNYDPVWVNKMNKICNWLLTRGERKEIEYREFYKKNGRHPNSKSKERLLRAWALNYAQKNINFKSFLIKTKFYKTDTLLKDYKSFLAKNKRQPSRKSKNIEERRLDRRIQVRINRQKDLKFKKQIIKLGYGSVIAKRIASKIEFIKKITIKRNRLPNYNNKSERKEYRMIECHAYGGYGCKINKEFAKWVENFKKKIKKAK